MGGGEGAQGSQLNYCLDAILKKYWQHNNASGDSLKQTGANRDAVRWQVVYQHPSLLRRTLSNEAFSYL